MESFNNMGVSQRMGLLAPNRCDNWPPLTMCQGHDESMQDADNSLRLAVSLDCLQLKAALEQGRDLATVATLLPLQEYQETGVIARLRKVDTFTMLSLLSGSKPGSLAGPASRAAGQAAGQAAGLGAAGFLPSSLQHHQGQPGLLEMNSSSSAQTLLRMPVDGHLHAAAATPQAKALPQQQPFQPPPPIQPQQVPVQQQQQQPAQQQPVQEPSAGEDMACAALAALADAAELARGFSTELSEPPRLAQPAAAAAAPPPQQQRGRGRGRGRGSSAAGRGSTRPQLQQVSEASQEASGSEDERRPPRSRSMVVHGPDPNRFYCPFEGCERSFASLWRLKVHYRAPPDVRGSGKERGHGAELEWCPKCGKGLKPGKHHIGCTGVAAAPAPPAQQERPAKRQRQVEHMEEDAEPQQYASYARTGYASTAAQPPPPPPPQQQQQQHQPFQAEQQQLQHRWQPEPRMASHAALQLQHAVPHYEHPHVSDADLGSAALHYQYARAGNASASGREGVHLPQADSVSLPSAASRLLGLLDSLQQQARQQAAASNGQVQVWGPPPGQQSGMGGTRFGAL